MSIITATNLSKKYKDVVAVDDVSFSVEEGERFAFLGPNGAGKSTTIKMLTTLLAPTSGTLMVGGVNPQTQKNTVRSMFGIVFQDPSLDDDLTAWENMRLHAVLYSVPAAQMSKRIEDMMKFVELWDRKNSLVKTFSGGMKRRLEIARGLLHHPKILFLDEPTLGLDPQTRNHMWTYIQKISQEENMTVFFTTHYMEEAERIAQRIAIIDHGKIVTIGTPDELKKQTGTKSLEEAFLKLTGSTIRDESSTGADHLRSMRKMWTKR